MEKNKTSAYKKNSELDVLLEEINALIYTNYTDEDRLNFPVLFVVGTPRSGTTLLTQWLASLNLFCYPTNFVSRFYRNPYVGYLIQEMLYNKSYSYKYELQTEVYDSSFTSDVGKTKGPLEPHEFWYFWRQHFQFPDIPVSNEVFMKTASFDTFAQHIAKVQNYFGKPFFLKSLIINWYIEAFFRYIPNAIFLYIKRDPLDNMQSLLDVRRRYFNDENMWFSFKPREYELIANEDKYIQVAAQVEYTNRDIEQQLVSIPTEQKIEIDYQKFCNQPHTTYAILRDHLEYFNIYLPKNCPSQADFSTTVSVKEHSAKLINSRNFVIENFL